MRIIACVDDNNGMMFNKRRQSRDRQVTADILELTDGRELWMNAYSAPLFAGEKASVSEEFLQRAPKEAFCFVENESVSACLNQADEIILYKWNRKYPADFYFDLDLEGWSVMEQKEFQGTSHEKITRERYRRGEEKE